MNLVNFLNNLFQHDGFILIDAKFKKSIVGKPIKEKPITIKLLDKSLNYKWFSGRYEKFAYIDRIVIMDEFKKNGIGKSLYLDLEKNISEYELIACEFNIEPPNPISKKFHESLNYENVGYQLTENETKKVSLMIKKIL